MSTYSHRPAPEKRTFTAPAVEAFIDRVSAKITDPKLRAMFANCYPNTLDTTVRFTPNLDGHPSTHVITGDIPAMWLRDSAAQVWPFLHLVKSDAKLAAMIEGLIRRHAQCVLLDPYANAFLEDLTSPEGEWKTDFTEMKPGVHERKWEVDSLAYVLRLASAYWRLSGSLAPFDQTWIDSTRLILDTFDTQRTNRAFAAYTFQRNTPHATDTLPVQGRGNPVRPCGLIRSAFRCSDDASILQYVIPANLMAATELADVSDLLRAVKQNELASRAEKMADEIRAAVAKHAIVQHPKFGPILAYEVDGYGSTILMDDAGIPSLVSLAYLGAIDPTSAVYQNTRRFALSFDNPYYFEGAAIAGTGSPHTHYGTVWPMGVISRGLTSSDPKEIDQIVRTLAKVDAGTGFIHESLDPNDPTKFSRTWFSWVNGLFGELVCKWVGESASITSGCKPPKFE
jgi:meiotically up-regulated gene 157 (Mug157) protein